MQASFHGRKQSEPFVASNLRVARNVRGGVYRSVFLRYLALSPDVSPRLSELLQTPLTPHGIPHQLAHLHFQPLMPGKMLINGMGHAASRLCDVCVRPEFGIWWRSYNTSMARVIR